VHFVGLCVVFIIENARSKKQKTKKKSLSYSVRLTVNYLTHFYEAFYSEKSPFLIFSMSVT